MHTSNSNSGSRRLTSLLFYSPNNNRPWRDPSSFGTRQNTTAEIFDLSDPAHPHYIRDYGVVGQEPGSSGEPVPAALHGPIRLGNRVYFGYGTSAGGILEIVGREKLLQGDSTSPHPVPPTTPHNLHAQTGR